MPHAGYRVSVRRAKAAAGLSITDSFGRADGALSGSTTETGGKVWGAVGNDLVIVSNKVTLGSGLTSGGDLVDLLTAGDATAQGTWTMPSVNSFQGLSFYDDPASSPQRVYAVEFRNTSARVRHIDSGGGVILTGGVTYGTALVAGSVHTWKAVWTAATKTMQVWLDGSVLFSSTDAATALAVRYIGFNLADTGATPTVALDNITVTRP